MFIMGLDQCDLCDAFMVQLYNIAATKAACKQARMMPEATGLRGIDSVYKK